MPVSKLDTVYRKMVLTKFFNKGWGNPENMIRLFAFRKIVSNRESCYQLVPKNHPIEILKEETWSDCKIIEGKFRSPFALHLPDVIPEEAQDAHFQMVLPLKWKSSKHRPICIHLAGTGDHYYWRRRNFMARPLLKADIGSIILENPFYGLRKPKDQARSCLHAVSDIFVMGGCLILESLALLHWCEKLGYGPLGLSGISMGGHMASLAATNWPKPVVLVPCLSWSTASAVFTEGVMSESIDWKLLEKQYSSNSLFYDKISNIVSIIDKGSELQSLLFEWKTSPEEQNKKSESLEQVISQQKIDGQNVMQNVNELKQSGMISPNVSKIVPEFLKRTFNSSAGKPKLPGKWKPRDAVHFMRGIMDECTHLKNFSVPFDTSLIIAVSAQADGYVPRDGVSSLEEIWPGAEVRYIDAGHVSAYIWYRNFFVNCIAEAFERAKQKNL